MTAYFTTAPGRLLLGACAIALGTGAAHALGSGYIALAVGMPLAIVGALVAVGLSTVEGNTAPMLALIFLPLLAFLLMVGAGVAQSESREAWGGGLAVLAVIAAIGAARRAPRSAATTPASGAQPQPS